MFKELLIVCAIILVCDAQSHNRLLNDTAPPKEEHAQYARYLVHRSNWTAMGTNSKKFEGFPMVQVISIADSPLNEKSTGDIYFYLTNLDFTGRDLTADNRLTLLLSQEQDGTCSTNNIDPMEPTCGRTMISGSITKVFKRIAIALKDAIFSFVLWHFHITVY